MVKYIKLLYEQVETTHDHQESLNALSEEVNLATLDLAQHGYFIDDIRITSSVVEGYIYLTACIVYSDPEFTKPEPMKPPRDF